MEPDPKRKRWPLGLIVIVALQLTIAVLLALFLLGQEETLVVLRLVMRNPIFAQPAPGWLMVGMLLLAVLGLWLHKRWGWVLSMILTGLGLGFTIWSYFQGEPDYLPMFIDVVLVFYLNQRDVQQLFRQEAGLESTP